MANSRNIKVSIEDEAKVLDLTNQLRFILNNIAECNDMWISDLNTLRSLECKLEDVFEFKYDSKTYSYKLKNRTRSK
ncbi:MAG: hypothetical protein GOVbin3762_22 [Prokaryotic dsDNA virus sp.]|nr:MAG: hypothetical protein GOVbin3762_22 [Prokaryotic dsDNA virus sp.]|tara:strand:+ start:6285 stop:6515 length:231 start_codon:yes stop_codon:yes gene_type:complete